MAYESRLVQSSTANALPSGTDPLVDNTASGDVQAIKILNPTAGSVAPMVGQQARADSMPMALAAEDAALLADLLTITAFQARIPALGQALSAGSIPVVLPAAQITTLTPPAAITGFATEATLDARTGALTETAPATDTASSGLNGRLQRIAQRLTSLITAVGSPFQAGGSIGNTAFGATQSGTWTVQPGNTANTTPWLVSPLATSFDVALTRPSDTTQYGANDEVSSSTSAPAVNTITNAARASGGMVRLTSARCVDSANQTTKPQLLVYIFDTTTTPNNDNSAFAPSDTVLNTCVGILPFNVWYPGDDTSGASGNAVAPYLGPPLEIKTSGSANLFFRVKVLNAYTPVSAEVFTFRFDLVQY